MSKRARIIAELRARSDAGTLSEAELEKFRPILLKEAQERQAEQPPAPVAETPQEEEPTPESGGGGTLDPIRALTNVITGDDVLQDAAVKDGARTFKDRDARVKELEAIPELWTKQVGGGHMVNTGRKFLDSIGYLGLEGDDKVLMDIVGRIDEITKASGSLNDPAHLRKFIDHQLAPYNVETEQLGDAILINFDDPLTGERHVTWANKPGFSGRDAISLMETSADGAALLGGAGLLRGGTRLAREFAKRNAWRNTAAVRGAKGRFVQNPAKADKAAKAKARAEAKAAKKAERAKGPKSGLRSAAQTGAEELAFSSFGLPGAAIATKVLTGRTPMEAGQAGIRAFSKIRRRNRELKQRR